MKLITLLIALLIIGLIVKSQIEPSTSTPSNAVQIGDKSIPVPRVPTHPQGVPKFEKDINQFMLDTEHQRDKQLEDL